MSLHFSTISLASSGTFVLSDKDLTEILGEVQHMHACQQLSTRHRRHEVIWHGAELLFQLSSLYRGSCTWHEWPLCCG